MKIYLQIFILLFILISCANKEKKPVAEDVQAHKQEEKNTNNDWIHLLPALVKISSYDGDRILESGQGLTIRA